MNLFLFCIFNQNGVLKKVKGSRSGQKHELWIHMDASLGLHLHSILEISDDFAEGYVIFNQRVYWGCIMDNFLDEDQLLFLTDTPVQLHFFKTALDKTLEGVQMFDEKGDFIYLNKTCEQMESLSLPNVTGKHVLEIYEVDKEYSTIMNTLKNRAEVKNRCGIFQNREGRQLYSLNTGIPVMLEDNFIGAIGLVYDTSTFSEIDFKRDLIQTYLKDNNKPVRINNHGRKAYDTFDDIIGESESIKRTITLAKKVAVNDVSILLTGETGVGKEIFAQSVHSASPRRDKEFVAINCAALPSAIVESLLFGTTKGAFTGSGDKKGLFEAAEGGTIFLDEINSMEINLQSKLLRVIQEKSFRRLGSTQTIYCNVRFITAMNETPETAIANMHLREDLYYRLGTILIEIPPLRARGQDILLLSHSYLSKLSRKYFRSLAKISSEAEMVLLKYLWPGNVRELFQVLEYACNMTDGDTIESAHFPARILTTPPATKKLNAKPPIVMPVPVDTKELTLQDRLNAYERQILESELLLHNCNITKTAERLGIKRQNLQYRIKKCGIEIISQMVNQSISEETGVT